MTPGRDADTSDSGPMPPRRCELCGSIAGRTGTDANSIVTVDLGNADTSLGHLCLKCYETQLCKAATSDAAPPSITPNQCDFCHRSLSRNHKGEPTPCWIPVGTETNADLAACAWCAWNLADEDRHGPPFRHCDRCHGLIEDDEFQFELEGRTRLEAAIELLENASYECICLSCVSELRKQSQDLRRCQGCKKLFYKEDLASSSDLAQDWPSLADWIERNHKAVCDDCAGQILDDARWSKETEEDARDSGWDESNDDDPMGYDTDFGHDVD